MIRLLIAGCAWALLAGGPDQRFRSLADAVRVDVLVTDGRRPVGGLTAADFTLTDSGVAQTIEDVQIVEVPFSMLLALDTSSSMKWGNAIGELKDAARAAIGALRAGDRASIVSFAASIEPAAPWNADRGGLLAQVDGLAAGGSTSLFDATVAAIVRRDPERGRRNLVVLFTDGVDMSSWLPDHAALDLASRTDIVVYTIAFERRRGAGEAIDALHMRSGIRLDPRQPVLSSIDFLKEIAARTGGQSLTASAGGMRRAFTGIVNDFRSRYVLSYTPHGVPQGGWHPIDVRMSHRRYTVTARRGYQR